MPFPINLIKPKIPPLTIHGAKTQSIPFIFKTITWDAKGKWVEGFLGAGTTFFNAIFHGKIREAYATELDPNIVSFYNDIKLNNIKPSELQRELVSYRKKLLNDRDVFYELRDGFNENQ